MNDVGEGKKVPMGIKSLVRIIRMRRNNIPRSSVFL